MTTAGILSAMLGLSFVSDFINRRAVHVERYSLMPLNRRIQWGTRETGVVFFPSGVKERVWYVNIRLPGWYWEPYYSVARDEKEMAWCHRWLFWRAPSFDTRLPHGWREEFVTIERTA